MTKSGGSPQRNRLSVSHNIGLASEPENEPVEQSEMLSDALMALREPTVKLATITGMQCNSIHWMPPEANLCSLWKQCLCQGKIARSEQGNSFYSRNHSAINPTPFLCYTLSYEEFVIIGGIGARHSASRWKRPSDRLGCLPDRCGKLVGALVCRRVGHVELPFQWLDYDRRACAVAHRRRHRGLAFRLP